MKLGEKIQLCRKKKGMSQEDLANLLNVSRQAVQKWESEQSQPEINKLVQLSDIFNVSLDWLIKDADVVQENNQNAIQSAQPIGLLNTPSEIVSHGWLIRDSGRALNVKFKYQDGVLYFRDLGFNWPFGILGCIGGPFLGLILGMFIPKKWTRLTSLSNIGSVSKGTTKIGRSSLDVPTLVFLDKNGMRYEFAPDHINQWEGVFDKSYSNNVVVENRISHEEILRQQKEEQVEIERIKKEEQRKNIELETLRNQKIYSITSYCDDFCAKKYNPIDKDSVKQQKGVVISQIKKADPDKFDSLVNDYKDYLSSFKIDCEYYQRLHKKRIRLLLISLIVVAFVGGCVGAGFGISSAVAENNKKATYDKANSLVESGNYEDALSLYMQLKGYSDSKNKISVCEGLLELNESLQTQSQDKIILGIRKIVKGKESVTVSYSSSSGRAIKSKSKLKAANNDSVCIEEINNENFSLLAPLENAGYTFSQWFTIDFSYHDNHTKLNLDSRWSLNSYYITYHLDGGINADNPSVYTIETPSFSLADPSKRGYAFSGWFCDPTYSSQISSINTGTTGNLNLYAKWEPLAYSITYILNGGTNNQNNPDYYTIEDFVRFYDAFKSGYKFLGWFDENDNLVKSRGVGNIGNITLEAKWKNNEYSINLDANGGFVDESVIAVYYDCEYELPSPYRNGYEFTGWYDGEEIFPESGYYIFLENKNLIAGWSVITYNIFYDLDGGLNNAENPNTYTIEDSFELKSPTKIGYRFKGWYDNNDSRVFTINKGQTEDIYLNAKWEPESYAITLLSITDECVVSFETDGANEAFEDQIVNVVDGLKFPGIPTKNGYAFTGWYKDSECTELYDFSENIDKDTIVYAGWKSKDNTYLNILKYCDEENCYQKKFAVDSLGGTSGTFTALVDGQITIHMKLLGFNIIDHFYDYWFFDEYDLIESGSFEDEDKTNPYLDYTFEVTAGKTYGFSISLPYTSNYERTFLVYFSDFEIPTEGGTSLPGSGGTVILETVDLIFDQPFVLPCDYIRPGYNFIGWYDEDENQITDEYGNSLTDWNIPECMSLYARWVENTGVGND